MESVVVSMDDGVLGANIKQLGVGVGDTVPVAVGDGVAVVVPGARVGVGVQGTMVVTVPLAVGVSVVIPLTVGDSVAAPLTVGISVAAPLMVGVPSIGLTKVGSSVAALVLKPIGVVVPRAPAPAVGPHATTSVAIATKTAILNTSLFIFLPFD
ncbi:MAG: hypothetical protein HZB51_21805 [Chloroflexi bacterium]|nr:hypothetical protein [Chloroflexota bacterium]